MQQIIQYFDRAYIINLVDRTDRRHQMEREFRKIGLQAPSEKVRFYAATRPTDRGNFPDLGSRGNFTSHRDVLDLASRDGLRNILVFEDDISFRHVSGNIARQIIERVERNDWDVIFFGYLRPSEDDLVGPLMTWPNEIMGAHFYAVNGAFINTMRRYMRECEARPAGHPDGGPMLADGAYNHVRRVIPNVRVLLAVPNLAHQRSSRTDVHPTPMFDRIVWLAPLLQRARAVKHQLRMTLDRQRQRAR